MPHTLLYAAGSTAACAFASDSLGRSGIPITDHPTPEITHLLLDVPAFRPDGRLRNGDNTELLLSMLPQNITVAGGNLQHPALNGYKKMDLLKDPYYLAANAAITADCALKLTAPLLKATFADTPALILGWGRIGKCLAQLLTGLHCPVTVAARKEADRAALQMLGYESLDLQELSDHLSRFRLLFNTVPAPVLSADALSRCRHCIKVELASANGIEGEDILIARGLPGTYAPESSGKQIASTFYRLWKEQLP